MTSREKPLNEVGEVTNLMANRNYSKITGKYSKITKIYMKSLIEFTDSDANKEGFKDLSEFRQYWEKNSGEWNPSTEVWVHEFEVVQPQLKPIE